VEYLGIIHRDIKPDNMVWSSEDRTTVKLVDFGISHFSPKQRRVPFARWRKEFESLKDPTLFPDNDLLKLRGTVYFIAPEVVGVYEPAASPESSITLESSPSVSVKSQLPRERPPVTKALDVWSLAVSLYCMLFGHFPFDIPMSQYSNPNQDRFRLYNEICTKDWTVPETMGADKIPTGGRVPEDLKSVLRLLDRMLQKNPKARATLYEVKVSSSIQQVNRILIVITETSLGS
jgi:serine/threonine protein kinase